MICSSIILTALFTPLTFALQNNSYLHPILRQGTTFQSYDTHFLHLLTAASTLLISSIPQELPFLLHYCFSLLLPYIVFLSPYQFYTPLTSNLTIPITAFKFFLKMFMTSFPLHSSLISHIPFSHINPYILLQTAVGIPLMSEATCSFV